MNKLVAICLTGGLVAMSGAQTKVALYIPGHSIKDQAITVRPWGSGTIAELNDVALEGTTSIGIFSRNYFQGGILTFGKPIDLSSAIDDSSSLLEITFRVADSKTILGGNPAPQPGRGGGGGGGRGGGGGIVLNVPGIGMQIGYQQRGQGVPPSFPGQQPFPGFPGQPGQQPGQVVAAQPEDKLDTIRLILTTTDNLKSELYIPISSSFSSDRGWRSTSFPLNAIVGFKRTNKIVKELALSADTQAMFYIGAMRLVNDTTPITGQLDDIPSNLALGDKIQFKARGYAGSTLLKYDWDFDDRDGIQVDATGPVVTRGFNKPGTFKITLTISDLYGQKKPFVKTTTVTVNP